MSHQIIYVTLLDCNYLLSIYVTFLDCNYLLSIYVTLLDYLMAHSAKVAGFTNLFHVQYGAVKLKISKALINKTFENIIQLDVLNCTIYEINQHSSGNSQHSSNYTIYSIECKQCNMQHLRQD